MAVQFTPQNNISNISQLQSNATAYDNFQAFLKDAIEHATKEGLSFPNYLIPSEMTNVSFRMKIPSTIYQEKTQEINSVLLNLEKEKNSKIDNVKNRTLQYDSFQTFLTDAKAKAFYFGGSLKIPLKMTNPFTRRITPIQEYEIQKENIKQQLNHFAFNYFQRKANKINIEARNNQIPLVIDPKFLDVNNRGVIPYEEFEKMEYLLQNHLSIKKQMKQKSTESKQTNDTNQFNQKIPEIQLYSNQVNNTNQPAKLAVLKNMNQSLQQLNIEPINYLNHFGLDFETMDYQTLQELNQKLQELQMTDNLNFNTIFEIELNKQQSGPSLAA